jgi:hypothetical protein
MNLELFKAEVKGAFPNRTFNFISVGNGKKPLTIIGYVALDINDHLMPGLPCSNYV